MIMFLKLSHLIVELILSYLTKIKLALQAGYILDQVGEKIRDYLEDKYGGVAYKTAGKETIRALRMRYVQKGFKKK